jgi:diguanylate cyclase (GGDEF)-like protein
MLRLRRFVGNTRVKITEYLNRQSKSFLMLLSLLLAVLIGVVDYMTGAEMSFSIFYLIPIGLVTWLVNRRTGILASIICAITWFVADLAAARTTWHPIVPYWNATVILGFFLIVTYILKASKNTLEQEKSLARTDPLTGAANRRYFFELAAQEMSRARRYQHPFTVIYLDLDNFKKVNDQFGHTTGDKLLKIVSATLLVNLRKTDIFARLGGDEFAIILPETGADPSFRMLINKLQQSLLQVMQANQWPVTFSIGVVIFTSPPPTVDEMIRIPDDLMYSVKHGGKNMVKYEAYPKNIPIMP